MHDWCVCVCVCVLEISNQLLLSNLMNDPPNELVVLILEYVPVPCWLNLMLLNKAHYQQIKPLIDDYLFERDQRVFNRFAFDSKATWSVFKSKLKSLTNPFQFDPSFRNNEFLSWACGANELDLVKNLLADSRVIAKHKNLLCTDQVETARHACVNGHMNVLHELFYGPNALYKDKGTLMAATTVACKIGQTQVVRFFLADPRVDICNRSQSYCPLCTACWQGQVEIVRLLLSDKTRQHLRITCARTAIDLAWSIAGNRDIVQMMLYDQRVTAELSGQEIIALSAWCRSRD